jgi:surfactin synthase thioesterase subunit
MKKKLQLFMLPYAGGSSFSFMKLSRFISESIETIAIDYPGRGLSTDDTSYEKYADFVVDVTSRIRKRRDTSIPYALLGYSMGSVLAFDIATKKMLGESPTHCFLCAQGSILRRGKFGLIADLNEASFLTKIQEMGGIDERLKKNEQEYRKRVSIIRSDFNILEQYVYDGNKGVFDTTIIYSQMDNSCDYIFDWSDVIDGEIDYYEMGSNHFFINQCYKEIAQIVNDKLT